VAPLKPATDALEIDTTALNAEQAFQAALALIRQKLEIA
jgi:cytidylate kinase